MNNEAQACFVVLDTIIMVNFMSRVRVRIQATILRVQNTYKSRKEIRVADLSGLTGLGGTQLLAD